MTNSKPVVLNALAAVVTLMAVTACTPRDPNWRNSRNAPVAAGEAVAANANAAARTAETPPADPAVAEGVGVYVAGQMTALNAEGQPEVVHPELKPSFLKVEANGLTYVIDLNLPQLENLKWQANGRVEARETGLVLVVRREGQEDVVTPFTLQDSQTLQLVDPSTSVTAEFNRTDSSRVEEAVAEELEARGVSPEALAEIPVATPEVAPTEVPASEPAPAPAVEPTSPAEVPAVEAAPVTE